PVTGYLPPGPHWGSWDEIVERFGWNERRRTLLAGLRLALRDLHQAGGRTFYLNGSFVTSKEEPGDFELAYITFVINDAPLETTWPLLFGEGEDNAAAWRSHYLGDILPHDSSGYWSWLNYFSTDRRGVTKGYVVFIFPEEPLI